MLGRDDTAVQKTNDDATQCKSSCVAAGYFDDKFVQFFVKRRVKKSPLINRGSYARHEIIRTLRNQFRDACVNSGNLCQVLNLGAGYDTAYFRLKAEGIVFSKFVELDFDEVALKKVLAVTSKDPLRSVLEQENEVAVDRNIGTLVSEQYCILPADLRDIKQVENALRDAKLDPKVPTFIMAECVLVYMRPEESQELLGYLGSFLETSAIMVYEQYQPDSLFGRQMIRNLEERGAPLSGVHATPTLEAHRNRLTSCGWHRAFAKNLLDLYMCALDPVERKRIERLEFLDEFEEWRLIMSHYCICVGVKDPSGTLDKFNFHLYSDGEERFQSPDSPARFTTYYL